MYLYLNAALTSTLSKPAEVLSFDRQPIPTAETGFKVTVRETMVTAKRNPTYLPLKSVACWNNYCRVQTFATFSVALAMLGLVLEPIWHALRFRTGVHYTIALDQGPHHPTQVAIRNGLFDRSQLRRPFLHDMDPLFTAHRQQHDVRSGPSNRIVLLSGRLALSNETIELSNKPRYVESMVETCCSQDPYYFLRDYEKPFFHKCIPKVELHVQPTCNVIHELSLDSEVELLSTKGSWRSVWRVENHKAVIKLLSLQREFDRLSMDAHAIDALAMDRLTASPYVINAYGFCSQSVITEIANTSGRDFIKQNEIRFRERLKMARDLARGLADLQAFHPLSDYKPSHAKPTLFAHNDINIANTVQVGGKVKWNDFNIGVLLRQYNATDCGAPVRFRADLWRSPEEINNKSYIHPQQSDVYGLGNILYQVLTRHQPWTHKEPGGKLTVEEIVERKIRGYIPTIPEQYKNTTRKEVLALLFATMSCYHPIPEKRPTSNELAHALGTVYDWVKNKKRISLFKVRDLFRK